MHDSVGLLYGGVNLTNTTAGAVVWTDDAGGAVTFPPTDKDGIALDVSQITITNKHATVSAVVELLINDAATGYKVFCKADGGGAAIHFPEPIRIQPGNTLKFKSSANSDILVSAVGHKRKG